MTAEQQLQLPTQSRQSLKSADQHGEVAIFETDACGFITSWSKTAEQLYGYDCDEIVGKHIASLYTAGDLLHGKPIHDLHTVEFGGPSHSCAWQKRKNEQQFWTYSECEIMLDQEGNVLGFRKFVVETPKSARP